MVQNSYFKNEVEWERRAAERCILERKQEEERKEKLRLKKEKERKEKANKKREEAKTREAEREVKRGIARRAMEDEASGKHKGKYPRWTQ